eukprot:scaffold2238_cov168-Pinguiococcus_pyrenoidosus.AAC.1
MSTFNSVLNELTQSDVTDVLQASGDAGNFKNTAFDLFFRLMNIDRNASASTIGTAVNEICSGRQDQLSASDVQSIAKLIARIRKANFPLFCPLSQQMFSRGGVQIQGNTLLRRQLHVGERYSVLFVPIECKSRDSGCPTNLRRMSEGK